MLFDQWVFYAGALISCTAVIAALVLWLFSLSDEQHRLGAMLSPAMLFIVPYLAFMALTYARPFVDFQDVPSIQAPIYYGWTADFFTIGLYLLGGLAFFAGYIVFPAAAKRYGRIWEGAVKPLFLWIKSYVGARKVEFYISVVFLLYFVGLAANLALFFQVRGIPILKIALREQLDPKLTFVAELQPTIVLVAPFVSTIAGTARGRLAILLRMPVFVLLVGTSLAVLTALGARNLPAKLALALLLFWFLSPWHRSRPTPSSSHTVLNRLRDKRLLAIIALGIALVGLVGVGGALTKVEIYRIPPQRLPEVALGSPLSDSIGNLYSFQAMTNYSGPYGHFEGNLLWTTFLSYVPGRDELYANYVVGEILGYPPSELVSISSTFNGPAYLDFGVLGLMGNAFLFGFLLGYARAGAKRSARNLGALGLFLATLVLNIHLGTYNIWTFFAVLLLISCIEYNNIP